MKCIFRFQIYILRFQVNPGLAGLLTILLLLLLYHFGAHGGHFGFDDMHYARLSALFAEGRFQTTMDHYTFRWGMVIPHGIMYFLFGVGDGSSAIVPVIATLLTLWCVFQLTGSLTTGARLWAMGLTGLSEWVLFYANKLMPDTLVMATLTGAITVLFLHRFGKGFSNPVYAALGVSLNLFIGFLCKETILLTGPLFLYLLVVDLIRKSHRSFWLNFLMISAGFALAYFTVCWTWFGDPFVRFAAIKANSYFNPCSYDQLPLEHTLLRVGYQLWKLFLENGVLAGVLFILPALIGVKAREFFLAKSERGFLLGSAIALLLLCNFMSTSPTAYIPLCLDIRHYLFVIPMVAAAAAVGAGKVFREGSWISGSIPALLGLCTYLWLWGQNPGSAWLYGGLGLVAGMYTVGRHYLSELPEWVFWALLSIPLFVKPVDVFNKGQDAHYFNQRKLVKKYLQPPPSGKTMVISSAVECNIDAYLTGFDSSSVVFVPFKALDDISFDDAENKFLIMNGMNAWYSGLDWDDYPEWVKYPDSTLVRLDSLDGVEWYKIE